MITNKIYSIISFSLAIVFIFLNLHFYLSVSKVGTDSVSWLLPAKSIIENRGLPYKDYWDTKPIGLILFSTVWIGVIGDSLLSFRLLHVTMVAIVVFGVLRFLNYVFDKRLSLITFAIFLITYMSPLTQTQPLLIELYGMMFGIMAINILISKTVTSDFKIFGSAMLFILSAQMKESYAFMALSVLPIVFSYVSKEKIKVFKMFLFGFIGAAVPLFIFITFMIKNNIIGSYSEVIDFIVNHNSPSTFSQALNLPKSTFAYLQYPMEFFLLVTILIYVCINFYLKKFTVSIQNKLSDKIIKLALYLPKVKESYILALLYSLGAIIGFRLQNKFGSHYNAQMILPTIFLVSIPLAMLYEKVCTVTKNASIRKLGQIFLILIVVVLLFPKKQYFLSYDLKTINFEYTKHVYNLSRNPDMSLENRIMELTGTNDCILHVYGWGVGTTYFYSDRQPCSRFFLVNLLPKKFYQEYRNTLVEKPPRVVYYSLAGADIDNVRFEKEVFNFPSVLSNCYVKDVKINGLYIMNNRIKDIGGCINKYK